MSDDRATTIRPPNFKGTHFTPTAKGWIALRSTLALPV